MGDQDRTYLQTPEQWTRFLSALVHELRTPLASLRMLTELLAGSGQAQLADFAIDDADEFHLGAEYQALGLRYPVALRLGAWFDPDHKLRYTGAAPNLRARFRPGSDEVHYAAGVGVVLGRAQLDLAVDLSPRVDTLSLSSVARF